MTDTLNVAAPLLASLVMGLAAGAVYFLVLWQSVSHLTHEGSGWGFAVGVGLRLALLFGGFGLLIWTGAAPLTILSAGLGFTFARLVATRIVNHQMGKD